MRKLLLLLLLFILLFFGRPAAAVAQGSTIVASGPCPTVRAGGPILYPGSFCFRTDILTLSLWDGTGWRVLLSLPAGATTITLPNPTLTTPTLTTPIFQTAPLSDGAHFAAPSRLPPGLGAIQWFVRPGSKPGTCQVKVQVGNSNEETPVAGLDNLPAGTSGC